MADLIVSNKAIVSLGVRELRQTEFKGELKFDIREWKGDKYEAGVRISIDGLKAIKEGKDTADNYKLSTENDCCVVSTEVNGRVFKRVLCSVAEMGKLKEVLSSIDPLTTEALLNYEEPKAEPKKRGRKATTKTGTVLEVLGATEEKSKEEPPKNVYEKFDRQFKAYRESQPEKRRPAFEKTHSIILEHMKSVMETSEEYNTNGMHPCKDSHAMMNYVMEKAFENHDATTDYEEAKALICSWADEYIGLTSDVEEWKKAEEKKKKDAEKRKKEEEKKAAKMKELEPKALEELANDDKYNKASDKEKAKMLKNKVSSLYYASLKPAKKDDEEGDDE